MGEGTQTLSLQVPRDFGTLRGFGSHFLWPLVRSPST